MNDCLFELELEVCGVDGLFLLLFKLDELCFFKLSDFELFPLLLLFEAALGFGLLSCFGGSLIGVG